MPVLRSVRSAIAKAVRRAVGFITDTLYGAGGHEPVTIVDFEEEFYRGVGVANFTDLITHVRNSNATMTDGYGPELVTNGTFDTDSDWTDDSDSGASGSIVDGLAIVQGNNSRLVQNISTEVGKTYFVTATCSGAGSARIIFVKEFVTDATLLELHFDDGETRGAFTATSTTTEIMLYSYGSGITKFDNVSVREMPALKWAPHNLLAYSEDFSNSAWSKTNTTITANSATAPDGTTTADTLSHTADGASFFQQPTISDVAHTVSVFVKKVDHRWFRIAADTGSVWFDLDNGVVGTVNAQLNTPKIESVGNDWYRLEVSNDAPTTPFSLSFLLAPSDGSFSESVGTSVYIWGAHLYRSDLGGMVDNPERGDSYVPTAVRATGPNLITNGTFDTDTTGWAGLLGASLSVVNGTLRVAEDGNDASSARAYHSFSTVVGKAYEVKVDYVGGTGVNGEVYINNSTNFGGALASDNSIVAGTTCTISFVATATTTYILLGAGPASEYNDYDNVSVRESSVQPNAARFLPRIGHHVFNGNAWVNEGLLAESEARTNLIERSNTFNLVWSATGLSSRTANEVGPDGVANSAYTLTADTNGGIHANGNTTLFTSGSTHTGSCYFKKGTQRYVKLRAGNTATWPANVTFDLESGVVDTETNGTGTIQEIGNGWYRCSVTATAGATANTNFNIYILNDSKAESYTGTGAETIIVWGAQVEVGSTPSSFIPSDDGSSTATRAAETFTIPSANLPWPSPNYIGSERLTGSWAVPTGYDNTVSGTATSVVATGGTTTTRCFVEIDGVDAGEVYQVTLTVNSTSVGNVAVYLRDSSTGSGTILLTQTAIPEGITFVGHVAAASDVMSVLLVGSTGADFDATVSVREINPLSVSIAMDGRMTYADEDSYSTSIFYRWFGDANNYLVHRIDTALTQTGHQVVQHRVNGVDDYSTGNPSNTMFSPDVLVPFDVAARHGSTFVQAASDGLSPAPNTTPTALPDLSASDLDLAYDYMGTIRNFRVWDKDIGDAGLVEATQPSTEPSLSLTFEGTGTNSFIVNDWSE